MFSGTGSLGFEALSRGATHITFIEKQKGLCESMDALAKNGLTIKTELSYRYKPVDDMIGYIHDDLGLNYHKNID